MVMASVDVFPCVYVYIYGLIFIHKLMHSHGFEYSTVILGCIRECYLPFSVLY